MELGVGVINAKLWQFWHTSWVLVEWRLGQSWATLTCACLHTASWCDLTPISWCAHKSFLSAVRGNQSNIHLFKHDTQHTRHYLYWCSSGMTGSEVWREAGEAENVIGHKQHWGGQNILMFGRGQISRQNLSVLLPQSMNSDGKHL